MFDMFCPFFTSYEQQCNPALPSSVPRYFKFLNSIPYTTAKAACIWGTMRKGLGQKKPFIESKLFHQCNKNCKWGTAILSSHNTMHGMETGKKKEGKDAAHLDEHRETLSQGTFTYNLLKSHYQTNNNHLYSNMQPSIHMPPSQHFLDVSTIYPSIRELLPRFPYQ